MTPMEAELRNLLVQELHTVAGSLQHCQDAKQLREQLRKLLNVEQTLIDLINEVEVPVKVA